MRRNFGYVLLGLGGLFLAVAVLALVWAPGVVKKTPLDVDTKTVYEGEGGKINTATGEFDVGPVYAIQRTKSDSEASSDDTVLFVETSCLVVDTGGERVCVDDTDPNLLTADIDIFATDRTSALAVDDENLPENAGPHEGLVNKWPFDVEKKTYPYWDGLVGRAGRHGVRGDRGRSTASRPTASSRRSRTSPSTSPKGSRAPTATWSPSTSIRRPARSSGVARTSSATSTTAPRSSTSTSSGPRRPSTTRSTTPRRTASCSPCC